MIDEARRSLNDKQPNCKPQLQTPTANRGDAEHAGTSLTHPEACLDFCVKVVVRPDFKRVPDDLLSL